MRGIFSTLAIVWRIASPYFYSEDRWAGRILLAAVIAIELVDRRDQCPAQFLEQHFLQCAAGQELGRLRLSARLFLRPGHRFYSARRLSALSQSMAADPLAALADARPISTTGWPTPITTACNCSATPPTIPTSALPRTSSNLSMPADGIGILPIGSSLLNSVVTLGSFAVILWNLSAAAPLHLFGTHMDDIPGYLLWAALIYAVIGTILTHLIGRALDRAELPAAALRSRFPLQSGARARELRADRLARRRARRTRPAAGALRQCRRQLDGDHVAPEEADLSDGRLQAGCRRFSVHHGEPGLFRRRRPARRTDADGETPSAACRARCRFSSTSIAARRMARGGRTPRRVRPVDRRCQEQPRRRRRSSRSRRAMQAPSA